MLVNVKQRSMVHVCGCSLECGGRGRIRAGFPTNKRNGRTRQLSNAECDRIDFTGLAEKKVCVCVSCSFMFLFAFLFRMMVLPASVCLSIYLSINPICLSILLSPCINPICLSILLSLCISSVCLYLFCLCQSICLTDCPSVQFMFSLL